MWPNISHTKTQQSPPWLEFGQVFLNQNSSNGNWLHQHISCIPHAVRLLLWLSTISQAPPQAPPALLIYYCYYCTPVSNHILMVEIFSMMSSMTSFASNSQIELTATNRSFNIVAKISHQPTNLHLGMIPILR